MTRSYIPPGGAAIAGRIFTRSEATDAFRRFARRHNYCTRTVRTMTSLRVAALREWVADHPERN